MTASLAFCPLRSRHIQNLPAEILTDSFWYLSFKEVRYAAQVCQRWRDLGIDHPIFWRYIEATSVTPGALAMLRARIGQTDNRPFTFVVDIQDTQPSRIIENDLMDLIAIALYNVRDLRISLNAIFLIELFRTLNNCAPKLERFHLKLYSPDRWPPKIPVNPHIFGDVPGKLEFVHIEDVIIPNVPGGIPAFSTVRKLKWLLPPQIMVNFPAYLFDNCPHMTTLVLSISAMSFDEISRDAVADGVARLHYLWADISCLEYRAIFIDNVPLASIPQLAFTGAPDFDAVYDLLAPLRSPFVLNVTRADARQLMIVVEDVHTGHTRSFVQSITDYAGDPSTNALANPLLENEEFHAQLMGLVLSASLWSTMTPYLTAYRAVELLYLELDSISSLDPTRTHPFPTSNFVFAGLRTLGLFTDDPFIYVSGTELVDFVDRIAPSCTRLELLRVLLADSRECLDRRFDVVVQEY